LAHRARRRLTGHAGIGDNAAASPIAQASRGSRAGLNLLRS
jgi:hypothetical protein